MDKTIIGRIGEKAIPETIHNYQSNILEQELTAKKNIRNKFADQGGMILMKYHLTNLKSQEYV